MDKGTWGRVTMASFLARLPLSMSILAMPLAARRAGYDVALGVVLTGATAISAGLLGTVRGRRLDRSEMRRGLQTSCVRAGTMLLVLAGAVFARVPFLLLLAICVLEGASIAGIFGGFRALLWVVAPGQDLARPQVLETLMTEVGYVVGPLAVLVVDATGGAVAVLLVMAILPLAAVAVLRGLPRLPPSAAVRDVVDPSMRVVILFAALVGGSFSMVENSVPSRMAGLGLSTSAAGAFLALLSMGSCVGGVLASARPPGRAGFGRAGALTCSLLAVLILPATVASSGRAFAFLLPLSSLLLVPSLGLAAMEVERLVGPAGRAHRFSALVAAQLIGGGLGAVAASGLLEVMAPADIPRVSAAILGLVAVGLTVRTGSVSPSRPG